MHCYYWLYWLPRFKLSSEKSESLKRESTLSAFSLFLWVRVETIENSNMETEEVVTNVPLAEDVDTKDINVPGLVSIIVFYLIVLFIGIWAGWKQRKSQVTSDQETVMLAGRNIGLFVGVLTMGGMTTCYNFRANIWILIIIMGCSGWDQKVPKDFQKLEIAQ